MKHDQHRPISRRSALAAGLAASMAAALPPSGLFAAGAPALITRPIPSTGERLPVVGIGTNAFDVTAAASSEAAAPLSSAKRSRKFRLMRQEEALSGLECIVCTIAGPRT